MHACDRRRSEELDREIAIRNRVERVRRGTVEAERSCSHIAIDRERGSGERCSPERGLVEPAPAIGEAGAVAPDHLDIGHQMVAESHRLGDLQVRVAGHHRGCFRLGAVDQRLLQIAHRGVYPVDRAAQPQPQISRHLIVPRARGVQPSRRRANELGQAGLDVHMDILALVAEDKDPAFDFRFYLV